MRRLAWMFALAGFFASQPVAADLITQNIAIDAVGGFDQLHLEPFDPTLGDLERVDVSIHAQLVFSGIVTTLAPWSVTFGLDMFGLAGNFFDFSDPGITIHDNGFETICSPTPSGCLPLAIPVTSIGILDLSFSFTDTAENVGINQAFLDGFSSNLVAFPPLSINGAVSDFLPSLAGIEELDILARIQSGANYAWTGQMSVNGFMQIDYTYSERARVPEPGTLGLLGIGLAALGISRRRRKIQMS